MDYNDWKNEHNDVYYNEFQDNKIFDMKDLDEDSYEKNKIEALPDRRMGFLFPINKVKKD